MKSNKITHQGVEVCMFKEMIKWVSAPTNSLLSKMTEMNWKNYTRITSMLVRLSQLCETELTNQTTPIAQCYTVPSMLISIEMHSQEILT